MSAHKVRTGLTSITGIGAKTAAVLASAGITDPAGLLAHRSDADGLLQLLADAGIRGLTHERLEPWFEAAETLAAATQDPESPPRATTTAPTEDDRHGEFTIFFDATGDGDRPDWTCRLYHAESGDDEELEGLGTWLAWVAERLGVPVGDLLPASAPDERRAATGTPENESRTDDSSRLELTAVEVAAAGGGHLAFEITLALADGAPAAPEPLTAHLDLVCLDAQGKVALAESWDEAIVASPHHAHRTTTGLGPGAYDVRATATLAARGESAERALILELVS